MSNLTKCLLALFFLITFVAILMVLLSVPWFHMLGQSFISNVVWFSLCSMIGALTGWFGMTFFDGIWPIE